MSDTDPTRIIPRKSGAAADTAGSADKTRVVPELAKDLLSSADEDVTRVFRPSRKAGDTAGTPGSTAQPDGELKIDPVVGWLVIVDGPGRGTSLPLGYGLNSIGRAPEERVALDFGDGEVSRTGHAALTYDPRGRRFYLQHGGGINLTYIGEEPVLAPRELFGRERILIGATSLVFVPFCGSDFEWQDQ